MRTLQFGIISRASVLQTRRSTGQWLMTLAASVIIGCGGQKTAPKAMPVPQTAPVATNQSANQPANPPANPNMPQSAVQPVAPSAAPSTLPWVIDPAITDQLLAKIGRKIKLGQQPSSNSESYSAFQTRQQAWIRDLIKPSLEASTQADSPQRTSGVRLVEITTSPQWTTADKTTAASLHQQVSEESPNPILDLEYAGFLLQASGLLLEPDQQVLIRTLISRGRAALPENTPAILKLRYLAIQEAFRRRGQGATDKSMKEQAPKIISAVLQMPIPEAEQRFVYPFLRETAAWMFDRDTPIDKLEPIAASDPNRWLKLMARAQGVGAVAGPTSVDTARVCLQTAWSVHPDWPEAATELIGFVTRNASPTQEKPRFWFDEATLAQFDYLPAYETMMGTFKSVQEAQLRKILGARAAPPAPIQAGDPALEFAIECLDSGRIDTQVPTFMLKYLDVRTISGSPYEARLREAMANYLKAPGITPEQTQHYQSQLAILDWRSGQFASAEKRILDLGENLDSLAFNNFGASVAQVLEECAARGKPTAYDSGPWHSSAWRRTLNTESSFISVRFSPNGKRMAVGGQQGMLKVWDTDKWSSVTFEGDDLWIRGLDFSRDGTTLATISEDYSYDKNGYPKLRGGGLILWDAATGKVKSRLAADDKTVILSGLSVAFAPDGKALYSGHSRWTGRAFNNSVAMWNLATSKIWNASSESAPNVRALAVTKDGKTLISGGFEGKVRGFEIPSEKDWPRVPGGKQLLSAFRLDDPKSLCERSEILSLEFHTNDKWLAIGVKNLGKNQLELWDVEGRKLIGVADGGDAAFSPDGTLIATATHSGQVIVYEVPSLTKKFACMNAHVRDIGSIAFHPSGRYVAAASDDGTISFWDPATGKPANVGKGKK